MDPTLGMKKFPASLSSSRGAGVSCCWGRIRPVQVVTVGAEVNVGAGTSEASGPERCAAPGMCTRGT
eukprot:1839566-Heterocapsa_arctica.AAC.1